ncbi:hypothetical protein CEXT_356871 [Caerostris extrusa]|uniref:Uncharacterized protein n=1 Tax=Caerostris extrusa TaxID=172846 RepID=A0AAV4QTX8_CAEEX|nr:hypothetical protein CEXT_356871 [Caerostris extrusa]
MLKACIKNVFMDLDLIQRFRIEFDVSRVHRSGEILFLIFLIEISKAADRWIDRVEARREAGLVYDWTKTDQKRRDRLI